MMEYFIIPVMKMMNNFLGYAQFILYIYIHRSYTEVNGSQKVHV